MPVEEWDAIPHFLNDWVITDNQIRPCLIVHIQYKPIQMGGESDVNKFPVIAKTALEHCVCHCSLWWSTCVKTPPPSSLYMIQSAATSTRMRFRLKTHHFLSVSASRPH